LIKEERKDMKRKWTVSSAAEYIARAENGTMPIGLTYWSAKDFLEKKGELK